MRDVDSIAEHLEGNLLSLHDSRHTGAYRALRHRRKVHTEGGCRQRPLGIAAIEDRLSRLLGDSPDADL